MYLPHFGLNQSPFGITPNPAFFYAGNKRGAILEALIYAVTHGEGIIKVTGEVGSGKTMLCRMLESLLPENIEVIYLVNPTLSREEVVFAIAGELGLATGGKRPDEVIRLLQHDLITKHAAGKQVVLLVEEAQAMPLDTLEEIRLFSNLETAHHKLLQIVLFGQPELDESLSLPRMRQLKERITHSFKVPPLAPEVIPEFLMFRMRAAGYQGPDIFSRRAIKLISGVSEGIVRRISILADKSLLAAFADNTHLIDAKHVKAAIHDSEFSNTAAIDLRKRLMLALLFALGIIGTAVAGWTFLGPQPKTVTASAPAKRPALASAPAVKATAAIASAAAPAAAMPASQAPTSQTQVAPPVNPAPANTAAVTATTQPKAAATPATPALPKASPKIAATASSQVTTAAPVAPKAPSNADSVQKKLTASKNWMTAQTPGRYSVQLALIADDSRPELEHFVRNIKTKFNTEEVYIFPTQVEGKTRYGVLYGSYATREEAVKVRAQFASQGGHYPQLRTFRKVNEEIAATKSSDLWGH